MKWYIAKLIFQIKSEKPGITPQFDEQIRLLSASDLTEALIKSRTIGIREQDEFIDASNFRISWKFIDVPELFELESIKDGTELYSRINETDNENAYINFIQLKAKSLETMTQVVRTEIIA